MWTAVTIIYLVAGVIVATRSLSRGGLRAQERSALQVACDLRTGQNLSANICGASERASEPRERSAPAQRRARERVGESEGRSPSGKTGAATMPASRVRAADYWTLTKPEVNLLIGVTTAAGFFLAGAWQGQSAPVNGLVHTVAGTLLVASGTGTLNQLLERHFYVLMRRTSGRPVAAGRIPPWQALVLGVVLATAGTLELAVAVNRLSSVLALATMASYLLVYTPLKRKTPLWTLIGAIPGAAPPLIGWAGATGALSAEAWYLVLDGLLLAISTFHGDCRRHRDYYRRAGYRIVPRDKPIVPFVLCQAMIPLLVLVPLSLTPVFLGRAGLVYLATALVLGAGFIYRADQLAVTQSNAMARRLLLTSIVYLPLIFIALVLDRV